MKQMESFIHYIGLYLKSFQFVWKSSRRLTFVLLLFIPIQAIMPAMTLYFTNRIINEVQKNTSRHFTVLLTVWAIAFLVGNLVPPLITFVQGQLTDQLTYKLNASIIQQSEKIQTIDYYEDSAFYDKINLLSAESSWRPVNLLVFGTSLIINTVSLLSMFLLLCSFQVLTAILLTAVLIPQGILSYRIQQQAFETLVSGSEDSRKLSYYSEVLLCAEYVKEVRLYGFFYNKYRSAYLRIRSKIQRNRKKQCVIASFFLLLTGGISVTGFGYITYAVAQKSLEPGTILIYTSAIAYTIQGISRFIEDSSLLYDTLLYMSNLFMYLEIKPGEGFEGAKKWTDFRVMKVDNLSFQYSHEKTLALDNVSFAVQKGEKIAIVGENGAGKSTLVKLILRLYRQDSGSIKFDDTCFEEFDIEEYRKQFGAVFQDFSRFDLTLKENIILAEDDMEETDKTVLKVLRQSGFSNECIDEIGLDHMLGKRFSNARELSGGQWQKLALGRAFYRNANILILDEPTATLDPKMEYLMFNKFMELAQDKTVLFITHRLASVRSADKVLLMKSGKIIGFDTHEILLQENAYYRELYQAQAAMYEQQQ